MICYLFKDIIYNYVLYYNLVLYIEFVLSSYKFRILSETQKDG
jgi:hypothetical protein